MATASVAAPSHSVVVRTPEKGRRLEIPTVAAHHAGFIRQPPRQAQVALLDETDDESVSSAKIRSTPKATSIRPFSGHASRDRGRSVAAETDNRMRRGRRKSWRRDERSDVTSEWDRAWTGERGERLEQRLDPRQRAAEGDRRSSQPRDLGLALAHGDVVAVMSSPCGGADPSSVTDAGTTRALSRAYDRHCCWNLTTTTSLES